MENEKLTDKEVDKLNMDEISTYISQALEYQETGEWTGFMGIKYDTPVPEPILLPYSWEL